MRREGGDRRYEVRFFRYGAAVFGVIPAGDLVALCECWREENGWDEVDAVIAQALGAVFVAGKASELRTWRSIVEEDAKRDKAAPWNHDPTSEELESYGDHTKENPHRYLVNVGLCDAVASGRWNTGMLDALARWAKDRILRDATGAKIDRLAEEAAKIRLADELQRIADAMPNTMARDRESLETAAELLGKRRQDPDETPTQPIKLVRLVFTQPYYWNGRNYQIGEELKVHPVVAGIIRQSGVAERLDEGEGNG